MDEAAVGVEDAVEVLEGGDYCCLYNDLSYYLARGRKMDTIKTPVVHCFVAYYTQL